MEATHAWPHLARKPKSVHKQLFLKDRWIAARTLYGQADVLFLDAAQPH